VAGDDAGFSLLSGLKIWGPAQSPSPTNGSPPGADQQQDLAASSNFEVEPSDTSAHYPPAPCGVQPKACAQVESKTTPPGARPRSRSQSIIFVIRVCPATDEKVQPLAN